MSAFQSFWASFFIVLGLASYARAQLSETNSPEIPSINIAPSFIFVENRGQLIDRQGQSLKDVEYYAEDSGIKFYFTKAGFHYLFAKPRKAAKITDDSYIRKQSKSNNLNDSVEYHRVDMKFLGANVSPKLIAQSASSERRNFYSQYNPQGILGVRAYARLVYKNLYPKIDLMMYVSEGGMKYDFVIHPGGNPNAIKIQVLNARTELIGDTFVVSTELGEVRETRPISYQIVRNRKQEIGSSFDLKEGILKFRLEKFNPRFDLTIDPPRLWASYYGGSSDDAINSVAIGPDGNIVVGGTTRSSSAISTSGAFQTTLAGLDDAFIAKFSPDGQRLWATYYGGVSNDGLKLALDPAGNIIGGGTTNSFGLSTVGAHQVAKDSNFSGLLVKFNKDGVRLWSTYYGGDCVTDGTPCRDNIEAVAIDSQSNIFIAGYTQSQSGIATAGHDNVFSSVESFTYYLAKFNPSGSRIWGEYVENADGDENIRGVFIQGLAADLSGKLYVSGLTSAVEGIGTAGAYQSNPGTAAGGAAFLQQRDQIGSLIWGTYIGANGTLNTSQTARARVAVSKSGVYIFGQTSSADDIAVNAVHQSAYGGGQTDAYLMRFADDGHLLWSTYFGGSGQEEIGGIDIGRRNQILISGNTTSSSGIATSGEHKTVLQGTDAFLAKFDSLGRRRWGTYYGGILGQEGFNGVVSAPRGQVVAVGSTNNTSDIATVGSHQDVYGGGPGTGTGDGFIVYFCDTTVAKLTVSANTEYCEGESIKLTASEGFATYQWKLDGSPIIGETSRIHWTSPLLKPGLHFYTVAVTDPQACATGTDTILVRVNATPIVDAGPDVTICRGDSTVIGKNVSAGKKPFVYDWKPIKGLRDPASLRTTALPDSTSVYILTVLDSNLCTSSDTVVVTVNSLPVPTIKGKSMICSGEKTTLVVENDFRTYFWNTGHLTRSIEITKGGIYTVQVTDNNGCIGQSTFTVGVHEAPIMEIEGPLAACPNTISTYKTSAQADTKYTWTITSGASITTGQGTPEITVQWQNPGSYQINLELESERTGCKNDTTVTVAINDKLSPNVTMLGSIPICKGDSVELQADLGYESYLWNPSGETSRSIIVKLGGDYSVSVVGVGGCKGESKPVHVVVSDEERPKPTLASTKIRFCEGDSSILSTSGEFQSYRWSTGASTKTITVKAAGRYSVEVRNAAGCAAASDSIDIIVDKLPLASLSALSSTEFCDGDSVALQTASGYSYRWFRDLKPIVETGFLLQAKVAGRYQVEVTNAEGCHVLTNAVEVQVHARPDLEISGQASLCNNAIATYTASGEPGSNVFWAIEPPTLGAVVSGQGSAIVTVQWNASSTGLLIAKTNHEECSGVDTLVITLDNKLSPLIKGDGPLEFCEGSSVTLDAGPGYSSYKWFKDQSEIATTRTIVVTTTGQYEAFVTSEGCSGSNAVKVLVHPLPPKPVIVQVGSELISSDATTYWWSFNGKEIQDATGQHQDILGSGVYTVTITDSNGCENTSDPLMIGGAMAKIAVPRWIPGVAGNAINIPLRMNESRLLAEAGATNYTATIRYNPLLLKPSKLTATQSGNWSTVTVSGSISSVSGELMNLAFVGLVSEQLCDEVIIDTFYFSDALSPVAIEVSNGTACVSNICHTGVLASSPMPGKVLWLGHPNPNPSRNQLSMTFDIPTDGEVEIELSDLLGRNTKSLLRSYLEAGTHVLNLQSMEAASGRYILRLVHSGHVVSRQIEVRK